MYEVQHIGKVHKSNGSTTGVTGVVGGLKRKDVLNQIKNAKASGQQITIRHEQTGYRYTMDNFERYT